MVPYTLAVDGRARLAEAGIGFEARDYPIGHWVVPEEIADLKAWLGSAIPDWDQEG
jgi:predicted esterase